MAVFGDTEEPEDGQVGAIFSVKMNKLMAD